jgi:hypothetical protein
MFSVLSLSSRMALQLKGTMRAHPHHHQQRHGKTIRSSFFLLFINNNMS